MSKPCATQGEDTHPDRHRLHWAEHHKGGNTPGGIFHNWRPLCYPDNSGKLHLPRNSHGCQCWWSWLQRPHHKCTHPCGRSTGKLGEGIEFIPEHLNLRSEPTFTLVSVTQSSWLPWFLNKSWTAALALVSTCVVLTATQQLVLVKRVGFVTHTSVTIADTAATNRNVLNTVVVLCKQKEEYQFHVKGIQSTTYIITDL